MATLPQDSEAVIIELGGSKHEVSLPQGVAPLPQSISPLPETGASDVVMGEAGHVETHGDVPKSGQFLPVEGGYILVEENTGPGKMISSS